MKPSILLHYMIYHIQIHILSKYDLHNTKSRWYINIYIYNYTYDYNLHNGLVINIRRCVANFILNIPLVFYIKQISSNRFYDNLLLIALINDQSGISITWYIMQCATNMVFCAQRLIFIVYGITFLFTSIFILETSQFLCHNHIEG